MLFFAFFQGWWNIIRYESRPYPGWLLPEQWLAIFRKAGFRKVNAEILMDKRRIFGGVYSAKES